MKKLFLILLLMLPAIVRASEGKEGVVLLHGLGRSADEVGFDTKPIGAGQV